MQISVGTARIIKKEKQEYLFAKYIDAIDKETNIIIFDPELEITLSRKNNEPEQINIKINNKITSYYLGKKGSGLLNFMPKKTDYITTLTTLVKRYGKMQRVDIKERLSTFKELFKKDNIIKIKINQLNLNFQKDYNDTILIPIN